MVNSTSGTLLPGHELPERLQMRDGVCVWRESFLENPNEIKNSYTPVFFFKSYLVLLH